MLGRPLNKCRGITGYRANFDSFTRNKTTITTLKVIRQRTFAELQGKITPPNSRPRRRVIVAPTIAMLPSQSTALRPAMIGVRGVSSFKNSTKAKNTTPEHGTEEISINSTCLYNIAYGWHKSTISKKPVPKTPLRERDRQLPHSPISSSLGQMPNLGFWH